MNLLLWFGSLSAGLGSLAMVIALDIDATYTGSRRKLRRLLAWGAVAACVGYGVMIVWAFGGGT